jgi:ligand-binding SRPBCC domain-containing protein
MAQNAVRVSSHLNAPAGAVWERATTPEGINGELMPIVRMTVPRGLERLDPETVPIGRPIGRSWILLFGVLPIDYDDITLVRLDPGRGFLERSPMLTQRLWEHERTIEPDGAAACVITDRVRYEPKLPLPRGALTPLFRTVFRHRHRRLRRHFGGYLESVA